MPATEIAFEYLLLALEATRGTAIAAPTHYLPLFGTITPTREKYRPEEARGTIAQTYRSKTTKTIAEFDLNGGLDPRYAHTFAAMAVNGSITSPTTPGGATLSRLWTFPATVLADNYKSATLWFGDPNVQVFRSAYCLPDQFSISADSSGTDAATMTMSGQGQFLTQVADPTLPAQAVGDLLMPGAMQAWLDSTGAIGTTEMTGRLISTEWTLPTGIVYKMGAKGPTTDFSFRSTGVKRRQPEVKIVVELTDTSLVHEYALFQNDTAIKLRVRLNGSLIETTFYSFVEIDIHGQFDAFAWGEQEGANRTMELTVKGEYVAANATDYIIRVQNTQTSL